MVSKRNRIIELKEFLEASGIIVNLGKTKARGNKGLFLTSNDIFRIDIAKNQDEQSVYSVMLHEYAHYIHYKYDKSLLSYNFLFPDFNDDMLNELLAVSVAMVPKNFAENVFNRKNELLEEVRGITNQLKLIYPDFVSSKFFLKIEKNIGYPLKFLLKYDRIRILNRVYSVENLESISEEQRAYICLKSKQRMLRRINSRISKLNRYYNKPSELISRFVEIFFTDRTKANLLAPICSKKMEECIENESISELSALNRFITK